MPFSLTLNDPLTQISKAYSYAKLLTSWNLIDDHNFDMRLSIVWFYVKFHLDILPLRAFRYCSQIARSIQAASKRFFKYYY